ncbi:MAG: long-chain fatty acid--CoA ligase, partial [Actinomycetota bacterium]|nr:long-chain fatty acid--CoA ligase [Actinomycetota bacterium]
MVSPTAVLANRLAARASDAPSSVAFVVDDGGELTFGDWERRSNAVARGLADRGIAKSDQVVLRFDNRDWLDYAVAAAAVLKVG